MKMEGNNILNEYPDVLNAKMIAKSLGIGYVKALNLIKYGGIKYIKIGNVYRVPKTCFIDWLCNGSSKEIQF
ncbi:helix-turn-helix domain-containing protein [Tissierella sp. Yu-01]|uniref:helix-turn-helix domain-containing protein n=1 Tax=Tissierella sp. Yu-01 TaxID=3035694 RepID=UPI00240D0594|nr:helix-turn-helix domain-containing protein [Tissierella sp. Yu-01]WFA09523.1 helix-turn-helix domain-containing protein [Tissierella sp. Yu-01]